MSEKKYKVTVHELGPFGTPIPKTIVVMAKNEKEAKIKASKKAHHWHYKSLTTVKRYWD